MPKKAFYRNEYRWHTTLASLILLFHTALPAADSRESVSNAAAASIEVYRVVVLPFQNTSGDASLDDWQHVLSWMLQSGLFALADFDLIPGKTIRSVVKQAGWKPEWGNFSRVRELTAELNPGPVIWGRFARQTNAWVIDVNLLRDESAERPIELRVTSPRWTDAIESMAVLVAKQFGRDVSEQDRRHWRASVECSSKAEGLLAKNAALSATDAPIAIRQEFLRQLLQADKRCAPAYQRLLELLQRENKTNDVEKLAREFLQERPELCDAHLSVANIHWIKDNNDDAEQEIRTALRLHPGCPGATMALAMVLGNQQRSAELRSVFEESHKQRPNNSAARILLAFARGVEQGTEGVADLLRPMTHLPSENLVLDQLLLRAAGVAHRLDLVGLELLRLGPHTSTNEDLRELIATITINPLGTNRSPKLNVRPRSFTPQELQSELNQRLSPDERTLVVNPVEMTPELIREAQRLISGLPNESTRLLALFTEVSRRGRGQKDFGRKTAGEALKASSQDQFVCQEYAKLFVGLARAAGLSAWLVHVDRDAFGLPGYHDCAVVFLNGKGILIDPTWRSMALDHQEFSILNDLDAISHHMMQPTDTGSDPRRLRAGLKLNPQDRWTRVQFVRGMAQARQLDVAMEELRKLQGEPESWDVHRAAANLQFAQERWKEALDPLQRALALSPSNAAVHLDLAQAYDHLNNRPDAEKHLEAALRLNRGEIPEGLRQEASFRLAVAQANTQTKSSRPELLKRAEAGDVSAQLAMVEICFKEGPSQFEEGLRWMRKVAEQGNAVAQWNYAVNLLKVRGEDAGKEAVEWLTRAAEQGNDDAQYELGLIWYEGKLAPKDMVAAYSWVSLAATKGGKEAKNLLKEMEIFIRPDDLVEARKRAAAFVPVIKAAPRK